MSGKIKVEFVNETGIIIENRNIVDNIWEMKIECPEIATMAKAGQFVNLKVASEGLDPILRRPISIAEILTENRPSGDCKCYSKKIGLSLVYAVVGRGTKLMSEMKIGNFVELIGPVGNGFSIEELKSYEGSDSSDKSASCDKLASTENVDKCNYEKHKAKKVAIVGGGIGTVPLIQLVSDLAQIGINPDVFLGFRGSPYKTEAFKKYAQTLVIATENGCEGFTGFVTEPFSEKINEYDLVYACGPEIMLKKVADICHNANIKLYVSMEERMACGIGACLVCVCKTVSDNELGWHHSKVCTEGPVFDSKEVFQWK